MTLLHLPYLFPSPLPHPYCSFFVSSSVLCLCFQFLKVKSACATPPAALVITLILSPPHSPVPSSLSHCVYPIRPLSALTPSRQFHSAQSWYAAVSLIKVCIQGGSEIWRTTCCILIERRPNTGTDFVFVWGLKQVYFAICCFTCLLWFSVLLLPVRDLSVMMHVFS